tara:strand:- start:16454 stop:16747 length:294 start_codon:yes stop_codon:yes gene_type:complete
MPTNKKRKKEKRKKLVEYKTKEERREQVKNILIEFTKLELGYKYEPVQLLYVSFNEYIEEGVEVKINIPFPMIQRRIVGELKIGKKENSVICLKKEN